MRAISITELNQQTSRVIHDVQAGESVEVSMHGQIVARIVPATDQATWLEQKKAEGRVAAPTDPTAPLPGLVPIPSELPLDQLIAEDKGEH